MKRILFVTGAVPPARLGGAERYSLQLAQSLVSRGLAVDVLGWTGSGLDQRSVLEGVEVHGLGGPAHRFFGFLLRAVLWLRDNAERYDVIQFFDLNHLTAFGLQATKLSGACRVARVEGVLDWNLDQLNQTHVPGLGAFCRRAVLTSDRYVVVSKSEVESLIRHGIPSDCIEFIPNGVDVRRFSRAAQAGPPVLACPARLRPEKNHEGLLVAFRQALERVADARLLLPGDGPCLTEIRRRIRELGLEGSVQLLGHVDDMASVLHECRLVALLSYAEGPALGILEAAAMSVPAVVTRVGGLTDSVLAGITGFVVEPGDTDAAAHCMVRLMTDDEMVVRMGSAARAFVVAQRSMDVVTDAYEEYLRTVGEQHRDRIERPR